jgi:hypothetical protein
MQKSLSDLSVAQLQRAIVIKQKIESLEGELAAVFGGAGPGPVMARRRGRPPGRRKSVPATEPVPPAAKRNVSAAVRKRLSQVAKARWKKAKAAGRSRL